MLSDASGAWIIQIQKDRFVTNWRRMDGQDYPRFDEVLRRFENGFAILKEFVKTAKLGSIQPIEYEMTYANHITKENGLKSYEAIGRDNSRSSMG